MNEVALCILIISFELLVWYSIALKKIWDGLVYLPCQLSSLDKQQSGMSLVTVAADNYE